MNRLKDLVSPAVVLVLANLEFLIVVIIVSLLVWLIPRRYRRHEERERQYSLRLTQQLQLRPRRKRQPRIEYVSQQESTPPSSEQLNFDYALCENCRRFFRLPGSELPQNVTHSETLSVLRQNAMNGCSVCALINRNLKDRPVAADEPVTLNIEDWCISWHLSSPYTDISVKPVTDNTSKNTPSINISSYTEHITNASDCYRPNNASWCLEPDARLPRRH